MGMVALQRVVNQPEILSFAGDGEGSFHFTHQRHGPQRRNTLSHFEGHMTRDPTPKRSPRSMTNPRIRSRPSAGTGPSPAVSDSIQLELFDRSTHWSVD